MCLNGTAGTGANLPATTADAAAVAYNGYVYQIGGYTAAATAVVDYAAITSSGALAAPASAACTAGGGTITGDWCASNWYCRHGRQPTGCHLPSHRCRLQRLRLSDRGVCWRCHRCSGLRGTHQQWCAGRSRNLRRYYHWRLVCLNFYVYGQPAGCYLPSHRCRLQRLRLSDRGVFYCLPHRRSGLRPDIQWWQYWPLVIHH